MDRVGVNIPNTISSNSQTNALIHQVENSSFSKINSWINIVNSIFPQLLDLSNVINKIISIFLVCPLKIWSHVYYFILFHYFFSNFYFASKGVDCFAYHPATLHPRFFFIMSRDLSLVSCVGLSFRLFLRFISTLYI